MMTVNAVVSAVFLAACALFTVTTPLLLIFIILVVGGFFRSLQFTAINTVAYCRGRTGADEPAPPRWSASISNWRFPQASPSARSRWNRPWCISTSPN